MTGNKFKYVIPINPDLMYKKTTFTVRGTLLSDPKGLTINFVNSCNITDDITYPFKVEFETQEKQRLTENYKADGIWHHDEKITQQNLFNGSRFYLVFTLKYEKSTTNPQEYHKI